MNLSDLAMHGIGDLVGVDTEFSGVSIDTRTLDQGNLFFAIVGPHFNGHEFSGEAASRGASALVVSRQSTSNLPCLQVSDTLVALQKTAKLWRDQFDIPVVAVTGSNGKTTVKEIIASIFRTRGKTLATAGNLNNDIGVPLTLLRFDLEDQYAVIEIGANHKGEIREIVAFARPDIAVVTMIGPSHLEGFGSIVGVSQAKAEIFSALAEDGIAVINRDDDFYDFLKEQAGSRKSVSFGFNAESDVKGISDNGAFSILYQNTRKAIDLPLLGKHNRLNALSAAAVAISAGFSLEEIKSGLESVTPVKGRLKRRQEVTRFKLIDDTYNANPASMKSAIDVLMEQPGVRCLVLGDMGELGDAVNSLHEEIGLYAKQSGVDYFFSTGPCMKGASDAFGGSQAVHCTSFDELAEQFFQRVPMSANVLVKGSRSAGMERFIDALVSKEAQYSTDEMADRGGVSS